MKSKIHENPKKNRMMSKTKFLTLSMIALLAITSISCSKDDTAPTPASQNPITNAGFLWRENDPNSTTIQTAASASFSLQYNTLIAKNATGNTIFEINLTGNAIATYNFGASSNNALAYTIPTTPYNAISGNCKITANANNKLSGTFECTNGGSSGVVRLYGTFTDIVINP